MTDILQSIIQFNADKPIIDFIGFNGPYITCIITAVRLLTRYQYLIAYILFYYTNEQINKILKLIIKQERPTNGQSFANEKYEGPHKYGFPSGHSQSIFFSLSFLYLVTNSKFLLLVTGSIATLTLYQRWFSRKHTVEQLFAGSAVGSLNGYLSYRITKHFIETKKTPIF